MSEIVLHIKVFFNETRLPCQFADFGYTYSDGYPLRSGRVFNCTAKGFYVFSFFDLFITCSFNDVLYAIIFSRTDSSAVEMI